MHMEGAEAIGPDLDALYLFHDMGLRFLQRQDQQSISAPLRQTWTLPGRRQTVPAKDRSVRLRKAASP